MQNRSDHAADKQAPTVASNFDENELLKRLADFGFANTDAQLLAALGTMLTPYFPEISERFTQKIQSDVSEVPTSTSPSSYLGNLSTLDIQNNYFLKLINDVYDITYIKKRLHLAIAQHELNLSYEQQLHLYSTYLSIIKPILWRLIGQDFGQFSAYLNALTKLIFFDISLITDIFICDEKYALIDLIAAHEKFEKACLLEQSFDALTKLPNRTALKNKTRHALHFADRQASMVALLHLDIDHFKLISEGAGHNAGDQILKEIADRLRNNVSETDTVAYLGSDEFALVLKNFEKIEDVINVCKRVLKIVEEPYHINDADLHLSCSIGVSLYPQDTKEENELFDFAEIAVNRAKELGRSNFQFYTDEINDINRERAKISRDLKLALGSSQLHLYYQPKADLQTGAMSGLEALIRWQHPESGLISPAYFIPIAEEAGLIGELGEWIMDTVCGDLAAWIKAGITPPCVAINVSPKQLLDPLFSFKLLNALTKHNVSAQYLSLEITEGVLMHNDGFIISMLKGFKEHGFILTLDDFGTGYSALSYLKHFPFDYVKIDQSFIKEVNTSFEDASISKAVIAMAHSLGIDVIAEGVENEAQCEFLSANMCDQIQGYYFSEALNAEKTIAFIQSKPRLPDHLLRFKKPEQTILFVDDEANILASLNRLLRREGYHILIANSGREGLDLLAKNAVDVIVSDQRMPEMTGVDFLRQAKQLYPDTVRMILSGYTELQYITEAINEGAIYKFLTKPWEDEQLKQNIKEAFQYKGMADENRRLNLQIQSTNQELAKSNRHLADVLKQKQLQISRDEASLEITREVLQHIPVPLIGVDEDEMIAFVNQAAEALFNNTTPILGENIQILSIDFKSLLNDIAASQDHQILIGDICYVANWKLMGKNSHSKGKLITLRRI